MLSLSSFSLLFYATEAVVNDVHDGPGFAWAPAAARPSFDTRPRTVNSFVAAAVRGVIAVAASIRVLVVVVVIIISAATIVVVVVVVTAALLVARRHSVFVAVFVPRGSPTAAFVSSPFPVDATSVLVLVSRVVLVLVLVPVSRVV